jgi:hypothetical protein
MTARFEDLRNMFMGTGYPEDNFVLRNDLINKVERALNAPFFSLITVMGPSRTGKTQLITHIARKLDDTQLYIRLEGGQIVSQDDLVQKLFNAINEEKFQSKLRKMIQALSNRIEINLGFLTVRPSLSEQDPGLPAVTKALKELAKLQCILVIDDCHKLPRDAMQLLLNYTKSLSDHSQEFNGLKIILIYIPTRYIRSSLTFGEFSTRVTVVSVTLWTEDDLAKIAMNILTKHNYGTIGLKKLAKQCFGLPAMMQRCCQEHFMREVRPGQNIFDMSLPIVLPSVAEELWDLVYGNIYEDLVTQRALVSKDLYVRQEDGTRATINEMIWLCLSQMPLEIGKKLEISLYTSTLHKHMTEQKIVNASTGNPIDIELVSQAITKMAEIAEEKYIEATRIRGDANRAMDPVFELRDDRILIYSPDFLFALRHAPQHKDRLEERQ